MAGAADSKKGLLRRTLEAFIRLPASLYQLLIDKSGTLHYSIKMADTAEAISISSKTIRRFEPLLKKQLEQQGKPSRLPTLEEKETIERLKKRTRDENRNNVTRTNAYWRIFQEHPELHWALLAHMVSRNGGWSMTDLRGELLPQLLSESQAEHIFAFLERANGLIFHDAYPQLLLYRESKKQGRSLFHLLPYFGVSAFMESVWHDFWRYRESAPLTVCLIINEQNYIESRVVQNQHFKQTVLDTLMFKAQAFLQLNQVVFPYMPESGNSGPDSDTLSPVHPYPRLAGLILEHFGSLSERIKFGKSLYSILYGLPAVHQGAVRFASQSVHTGSRSDYWPQLFSSIRKASPRAITEERLSGCQLKEGAPAYYSPALAQTWPDRELAPIQPGDWFTEPRQALKHLHSIPVPFQFDMTTEFCFGLNKIELAIAAQKALPRE